MIAVNSVDADRFRNLTEQEVDTIVPNDHVSSKVFKYYHNLSYPKKSHVTDPSQFNDFLNPSSTSNTANTHQLSLTSYELTSPGMQLPSFLENIQESASVISTDEHKSKIRILQTIPVLISSSNGKDANAMIDSSPASTSNEDTSAHFYEPDDSMEGGDSTTTVSLGTFHEFYSPSKYDFTFMLTHDKTK